MNSLKYILFFIYILIFQISLEAQISEDIGKFTLGIACPDNANNLTASYYPKLESKISKALTSKGYTTFGDSRFVCLPSLIIGDVSKAEGGMKDVYSVAGNLEIIVRDNYNGTVFQTINEPIKGHAVNEVKAISNAISSANLSEFSNLLPSIKEKIVEYFITNKNKMIMEAKQMAGMNNFDEAISYLMSYPSEIIPEYSEVLEVAVNIYDQKIAHERQLQIENQMSENNSILMRANNALQSHNPQEALQILWDFIPGFQEQDDQYKNIVASANQQITSKEKAEFEKAERAYKDARKDKEREFFLENKKIDTHRQIENKRINAQREMTHHYIDASQVVASRKIDAMKKISLDFIKSKNKY